MLLIILLGVITKLAMVSAECDFDNIVFKNLPLSNSDRSNVSYSATLHNIVSVNVCEQNSLTANMSHHVIVYRYLVLAVLLVQRERK
jgi:hypothetical protein